MKPTPIFHRAIGTIHDLGRPREWLREAMGMLLCALAFVLFLIFL